MDGGISVTAGLLTLAIFVCNTSKTVYETIESFKDRRKAVRDVQDELKSMVTVLDKIQEQAQRQHDIDRLEPLRLPLICCADVCQELQGRFDVCTKHSTKNHSSVRDWIKIQYRGKSFDDMKNRMASYKSTLSLAFDIINL
jgi:Fungal N-terminal domain of STAND proteins